MRLFLYHLIRIVGGHAGDAEGFRDLKRIGTSDAGRLDLFEQFLGKPVARAKSDEIARVRSQVQSAMVAEANGLLMVKTHSARADALGFATIDPAVTAGAVYVVRNPLDVAVSMSAHYGITIDEAIERMGIEDCVQPGDDNVVYTFLGSWSQNAASWTASGDRSTLRVRYEDLLANPTDAFGRVASFIGQRPSAQQLATAIELVSFTRLQQAESKFGFPEAFRPGQQFFRAGRSDQWRTALSEAQVRRIVLQHGFQMRQCGYLTEDLV